MCTKNDALLFGVDETSNIVAFSSFEREGKQILRAYVRNAENVSTVDSEYMPFLFFSRSEFVEKIEGGKVTELGGSLDYKYIARFPTIRALERSRRILDSEFKGLYKRVSDEYLHIGDEVQQGLLTLGMTHFKGMVEEDVVRMQLDIETNTDEGFEFSNAQRDSDEIIIVTMADSSGRERVLTRLNMSECDIIAAVSATIAEWNPDVIEGHNIFNFDLPYIETRAKMHGVKLDWGRDRSAVKGHSSRVNLAERRYDYTKYEVEGRAFLDTYILVQFYDIVKREMESYGLKEVAQYLGVAIGDRTYVAGNEISQVWKSDPDRLIAYALDDVRETRAIAAMLGAPYFYQAQMLPFSYQDVYVRGNAMKINGLMLRHYLDKSHSVPKPQQRASEMVGGYTDVREFGVINDVVACDVASLYPSLMLSYRIEPAFDELHAFLDMLDELRTRRLETKTHMKRTTDSNERRRLDNQQGTFKILINSFFGYLGADGAYFGDSVAGNTVTTSGRELLKRMIAWLEAEGARIIEVDTDGIYFVPPQYCHSNDEIETLIERLSSTLPEGINVEVDGRYPSMLSYKAKNYALLRSDGQVIIKGSGLKSRGLEPFQRDFIKRGIRMILAGEFSRIDEMHAEYHEAISKLTIPLRELAKTERLQDPLDMYKSKISKSSRGRQAGYELAIAGGRDLKPGDYVTYYVTGDKKNVPIWKNAKLLNDFDPAHPDVNIEFYLAKLEDVCERVRGFIGASETKSADSFGIKPNADQFELFE